MVVPEALRRAKEAARAEIGEIEPAEGGECVENPGRHQPGADEGHQRQARPEEIADKVVDQEFGAFAPPLGRTDAEEGDDGGAGRQHDDGARDGGIGQQDRRQAHGDIGLLLATKKT
jgi:hypothetical protein